MEKVSFFDEIEKNRRNSIILASVVFLVLTSLVYVMAYSFVPEFSIFLLAFAVVFVTIYIYGTYNYGDSIVLSSVGAREVNENDKEYVHLFDVVDGLSIAAGIPRPKVYVIESDEMNAFATGKDAEHASIAVTTGLLEGLKRDELEGVIGHELSHIANYDIRFATLVAVMVGLIAILSDIMLRGWRFRTGEEREEKGGAGLLILIGLLLAIFSPLLVRLVQFAISRKREFLADASSAKLTRYPEGLASALEKIMKVNEGNMKVNEAVSHLFFVDPNKSSLDILYATHPPIKERIKLLRAM